jgi:flagellar hook-associated protein 3 FlgL
MIQRSLLADVQRAQQRLALTQRFAATGLRVTRPSDDPNAAGQATSLRAEIEEVAQLQRNESRVRTRLTTLEQSLADTTDVLIRARELAIQAANDPIEANRALIGEEIESLHAQLVQIGNKSLQGSHLYSGFATDTPAFSASGPFVDGSPPPTVAYGGDSNEIQVEIEQGFTIASTLDGRRVFMGDADGDGSPDAGKVDLFETLGRLWDGLVTNDVVAIRTANTELQQSQEQIEFERAGIGARMRQSETAGQALADAELALQVRLSDTQDADAAAVYTNLALQQASLEASLKITADAIQLNLLAFLG